MMRRSRSQGCDYYIGEPGVNVDYAVAKNTFRDYIADYTEITDHSESKDHKWLKDYFEAGTKE